MRLPYATPKPAAHPEPESALDTRLRGRWLLIARGAWLAVFLLTIVVFVATLSIEYARLQQVCFSGDCEHPHLTPESLTDLQAIELSANAFAAYFITAIIIFALVWLAAGALIFWHQSDDR